MDELSRYQLRQRQAVQRCVFGCGVLIGSALIALVAWLAYELAPASEPTVADLRAEGDEIVRQLEAYKNRHNRYPPDLASAHIVAPSHERGIWAYDVSAEHSSFSLLFWIRQEGLLIYRPRTGWTFEKSNESF